MKNFEHIRILFKELFKEHELFSYQVKILRIKREISIFQAARNRGHNISEEEVKKIIDTEFAEYKKHLEQQQEKLRFAEEYFRARPFTAEEAKAFKKLYHDIVRKLHPDLNPDLPDGAIELWERVQAAYKANLWDELFLLSDMADELLKGSIDHMKNINSMVQILEELEKITQKTSSLTGQIADIRKRVPFSYESLLNDPAEIMHRRRDLDNQIKLCREHLAELKIIRSQY